jgi:hypothetical protein
VDIQNSALKAIKVLIVVLQGLTGMQDLRLDRCLANSLTAKIMSGLQHLSVLKLHRVNNDKFELGGQRDHCYRSKLTTSSMLWVAHLFKCLTLSAFIPSWAACGIALDSVMCTHAGSNPTYMLQLPPLHYRCLGRQASSAAP